MEQMMLKEYLGDKCIQGQCAVAAQPLDKKSAKGSKYQLVNFS
jgi:hypothetical protein